MSLPQTPSFQQIQLNLNGKLFSQTKPSHDLKKFASTNLKKIKLTSEKRGIYDVYHLQRVLPNSQYKSEIEAQYLLKFMIALFIKQHIDNNLELPCS